MNNTFTNTVPNCLKNRLKEVDIISLFKTNYGMRLVRLLTVVCNQLHLIVKVV